MDDLEELGKLKQGVREAIKLWIEVARKQREGR